MLRFKKGENGAKAGGLKPEALIALMVAERVFDDLFRADCWVTSGTDSHKKGLHPDGYAVDLRTVHVLANMDQARDVAGAIRDRLPDEYDVVLESDHIHVEYDPNK